MQVDTWIVQINWLDIPVCTFYRLVCCQNALVGRQNGLVDSFYAQVGCRNGLVDSFYVQVGCQVELVGKIYGQLTVFMLTYFEIGLINGFLTK